MNAKKAKALRRKLRTMGVDIADARYAWKWPRRLETFCGRAVYRASKAVSK